MLTNDKIPFLLDTLINTTFCTCAWWASTFKNHFTWWCANHALV